MYISAALCVQALKSLYIYIYGLYKPNPSLEYIYMGAVYMFAAFIQPFLCIIAFACMVLGMLQAVVLHHFGLSSCLANFQRVMNEGFKKYSV